MTTNGTAVAVKQPKLMCTYIIDNFSEKTIWRTRKIVKKKDGIRITMNEMKVATYKKANDMAATRR